jgi:hypothetical protein
MTRPQLKAVSRQTPEREALAERIAEYRAMFDQSSAVRNAIESRMWQRIDLSEKVEQAQKSVDEAKLNAAQQIIDGELDSNDRPTLTVRQARDSLQELNDQIESIKTIEGGLQDKKKEIETRLLPDAKLMLDSAFQLALKTSPEVIAVFNRYRMLQRDLAAQYHILQKIVENGGTPDAYRNWHVQHNPKDHDDVSEMLRQWDNALVALRLDADAPLPTSSA